MAVNSINNINNLFSKDLKQTSDNKTDGLDFADMLKNEINSTNQVMQGAEKAEVDIATGSVKDLAKANIAIEKADMKMQMLLEVRNKAINAYKELSKIQM